MGYCSLHVCLLFHDVMQKCVSFLARIIETYSNYKNPNKCLVYGHFEHFIDILCKAVCSLIPSDQLQYNRLHIISRQRCLFVCFTMQWVHGVQLPKFWHDMNVQMPMNSFLALTRVTNTKYVIVCKIVAEKCLVFSSRCIYLV